MEKQQVRKIEVTGELGGEGVTAKDVILTIIGKLGTDGGVGYVYVYEYAGEAIEDLGMEGRMSICNMSIEGGARGGYVNPDETTTYEWLSGDGRLRRRPREVRAAETLLGVDPERRRRRVRRRGHHRRLGDRTDRHVGDHARSDRGHHRADPGSRRPEEDRDTAKRAQKHMRVEPGDTMEGYDIDVAFLGSCTNARLKDLREAAAFVEGREVDDDDARDGRPR